MADLPSYKFIDLFAGIGGFHLAFNLTERADCVFASEWDEHARKTYRHNFNKGLDAKIFENNDEFFARDITKFSISKIPQFDILCGGFPCQPFSQVGLKRGFKDERGNLFFRIEKIIRKHNPAAIFLENVRGLLTHDNRKTFNEICRILKSCGYHGAGDEPQDMPVFVEVVRASEYGLPQHRPRLYMAGFKSKTAAAYFAKNRPKKAECLKYTMSDILGGRVTYYRKKKIRDIGFTLRCGGRGSGVHDRRNWDWYVVDGKKIQIHDKEGLLLQGFNTLNDDPRGYSFPELSEVPMTQRMKQLGNSVAVDAVKAWADAIIAALDHAQ